MNGRCAIIGLAACTALAAAGPAGAEPGLERPTRALVDAFQVNCLANLGDFTRARATALRRSFAPVPQRILERLGADEAWILPDPHGEMVLGLSAGRGCGLTTRRADPALAVALLAQHLVLRTLDGAPAAGADSRSYRVLYRGRQARLRVIGFAREARGTVGLTVRPGAADGAAPELGPEAAAAAPGLTPRTGRSAVAGNLPLPPLPGRDPAVPPSAAPPPTPAWDPAVAGVENLMARQFDEVCYRTRIDHAAIEGQARTGAWTPMDKEATIRGGFDQGWEVRAATGETVWVFYDPLGPKCCVSAFPARRDFVTAAIGTRYALGAPRRQRAGAKQIMVYRARKAHLITLDFEEVDDRGTFASVCYARR